MNKKIVICLFLFISLCYSAFQINYHQHTHQTQKTSESKQEEALFSEGAFYYSFYKDIVNNPSYIEAIKGYFNNSNYEAPQEIQPHKRFNISYELIAGSAYRLLKAIGIPLPAIFFYNAFAYALNSLSLFFILLIVYLLSKNIWLSLLTSMLFFTHFQHLSRMVTNTPLRENIGITFLLSHIFATLLFLKSKACIVQIKPIKLNNILTLPSLFFISTLCLQLIFWQFTQFALIVNIIAILILFQFNHLNKNKLLDYFTLIIISWFFTLIYLHGSLLVFNSLFFYISACFSLFLFIFIYKNISLNNFFIKSLSLVSIAALALILHSVVSKIFSIGNDSHVFKFITQRFKDTSNFHAKLYLCDDAFNSLGQWKIDQLLSTGLIYLLIVSVLTFFIFQIKKFFTGNNQKFTYYFLFLITIGFCIIAYMSQRFINIAIPLAICFISLSIFYILNYLKDLFNNKHLIKVSIIVLSLLLLVTNKNKISDLWNTQRQNTGTTLAQLSSFIKSNTNSNSIFAGSMPITSSVRLLTQRKIFIHPQYENAELRSKVKETYKVYGNFKEKSLHTYFSSNKVNYIVTEGTYCYFKSSTGCVMQNLINEGNYQTDQQFCDKNFSNSKYFKVVFDNRRFKVLKVL